MNHIISIDWDHTLRKMAGMDVDLLILILYARAKKIPICVTTHRDIENTTLYTLYPWQRAARGEHHAALAAAISYWQENLFQALNIHFDFINARYQPLFPNQNYYAETLLPLEKALAQDILSNQAPVSQQAFQQKILSYTHQKEQGIANNQYKEAQIKWLHEQYDSTHASLAITHLDDDPDVARELPQVAEVFSTLSTVNIRTIFVEDTVLSTHSAYVNLVTEIGLLADAERLLDEESIPLDAEIALSACLYLAQKYHDKPNRLTQITHILQTIEQKLKSATSPLLDFTKALLAAITANAKPVYLIANDLEHFIFNA